MGNHFYGNDCGCVCYHCDHTRHLSFARAEGIVLRVNKVP